MGPSSFDGKDAVIAGASRGMGRNAPPLPRPLNKPTKLDHPWKNSDRAKAGTQTEG